MTAEEMLSRASEMADMAGERTRLFNQLEIIKMGYYDDFMLQGLGKDLSLTKMNQLLLKNDSELHNKICEMDAELDSWNLYMHGVVAAGWKSNLDTNSRMSAIYEKQ